MEDRFRLGAGQAGEVDIGITKDSGGEDVLEDGCWVVVQEGVVLQDVFEGQKGVRMLAGAG